MAATIVFLLLLSSPAYAFRFASGFFKGTAFSRTIDISDTSGEADFQPDVVIVKCNSTTGAIWRVSSMASGVSFALSGTGGALIGYIGDFSGVGFDLGTNAVVNGSGVDCWYLALANDASNDLAVGTYEGSSVDDTDIDISDTATNGAPDILPQLVLIQRGATNAAQFKVTAMASTLNCSFNQTASACANDRIKALNATGFRLGTSGSTNSSTGETTYYYLAIKAVSNVTASGTFTGNTSDNRTFTTLGFQPEAMLVRGNSGSNAVCMRFKANSGDQSFRVDGVAPTTNQIQDFLVNGFEIGTGQCANEDLITMYWFALKEPPTAPSTRRPIGAIIFP